MKYSFGVALLAIRIASYPCVFAAARRHRHSRAAAEDDPSLPLSSTGRSSQSAALDQLRAESQSLAQELATYQGAGASLRDQSKVSTLRRELSMLQRELSGATATRKQATMAGAEADDSEAVADGDAESGDAGADAESAVSGVSENAAVSGNDDLSVRPSAAKGEADIVEFGLYAKTFYGLSMKDHTFTMDNVMTLMWTDERTKSLVPDGASQLTLSAKAALSKIWMPEVIITNKEIRKFELVSTSVIVTKDGSVTKIERSLAQMKKQYDVKAFPFDEQGLTTRIASSKYMLNELKLKPMSNKNVTGVNDGLFDGMGFSLTKYDISEFEEKDGALQKSRGVMTVTVQRDIDKYVQNHLIPSFLLLMISNGVFWFPYVGSFITPRLALSILALLSFVTLCRKVDGILPPTAPFNWNDLYNTNCQFLMFFTIVLNIFIEIVFHQLKCEDLGRSMNHEMKIVWPILLVTSMSTCFSNTTGDALMSQGITSVVLLFGFVLVFMVWAFVRLPGHLEAVRQKAEAAATK